MVADYLIKPLCGEKFKYFRNKIMNLSEAKLIPLGEGGGEVRSVSKPESNTTQVAGISAERITKMMICRAIRKLQKELMEKN